jgi:hypothetical protein
MFTAVESGAVKVRLWDPAAIPDPAMTNQRFLREYVARFLQVCRTKKENFAKMKICQKKKKKKKRCCYFRSQDDESTTFEPTGTQNKGENFVQKKERKL